MSEINGKGLLTNGVDEACELLRKLMETPGLYSLEFKFIYHGYDVAPAIEYQVCKYAGYPDQHLKLKIVSDETRTALEKAINDFHE